MKRYAILFFLLASILHLRAQLSSYDDIVPPPEASPSEFEDWLVQLAWQNQANTKSLAAQVAIADLEIQSAKRSWMDQLNANINFASQRDTIYGLFNQGDGRDPVTGQLPTNPDGSLVNNQYLRPGFNYGIAFNIGGLVNNKLRTRIAREEKIIAESRRDQRKFELRAIVLSRLEAYDNAKEVLKIRRQSQIDAETNYRLVQSLFEQGKAQFEDVSQASEAFHRSVEAVANADSNVVLAQYALEEIVGQRLSEILAVRRKM